MPLYLFAAEAAALLGISRQTLYAYVSRGLLRAHPTDNHRVNRYRRDEVEALARSRARGRKPRETARATLNWGLPVLESGLTLIRDNRLYYRGRDAVRLAGSASVEQVAALLWQCDESEAFAAAPPPLPPVLDAVRPVYAGQSPRLALPALFALAPGNEDTAVWQTDPKRRTTGCGNLLRILAACLLGTSVQTAPLHRQCARAWNLDEAGAELARMALVLCADHELNASGFTARCIASTGASLHAAVLGGLCALGGGRHGGATDRIEAFWDEMGDMSAPDVSLRRRLERGDALPGFGHPLYPDGDARATALLAAILPARPRWKDWLDTAERLTGQRPSIDLALVAARRHLNLPQGSAFGLFALGRSIGWIAHALEQRAEDRLIRPRAAYAGPPPES
ncbi:citrate synthase family protein [Paludibacterium paludis]|uniref:citrate synthase (unknown stereospecificity) n=1 Tax=Paludibacterium paludis TaxID=1225769 RepID=A0A918UBM9_9NEIS|nr:citrate synthase family protein [Paludibacterium paludis]GGY23362.1 hypothetical protein GCM10011289_28950 [Paludibacterium paludis]